MFSPHVSETTVTRADAPKALEYNWGGFDIRWELEAFGGGPRLTLWTNIDRRFISMGAAGWHICFIVNTVAVATGRYPGWVGFLALLPLALLMFTGLYLFVLPYATKWRSGRRTD